jgi:hypothetical protein
MVAASSESLLPMEFTSLGIKTCCDSLIADKIEFATNEKR